MRSKIIISVIVAVVAVLVVVGLTLPPASVNAKIDNAQLTKLKGEGALIVDVRTPQEYQSGHIPDAINAPVDTIQEAAASWDKSRAIVVYCATGARSTNAAAYLAAQGFKKVYDLEKGIAFWDGETSTGQADGTAGTAVRIETKGKPVFIDFSGST